MDGELLEQVRQALDGWLRGDISVLEQFLHPDVELTWLRTGEWDLRGKKAVLDLLKQRVGQREPEGNMELFDAGADALVLTRAGTAVDGVLPASLILFTDGKIRKIEQFRSRAEAETAARWRVNR